MLDDWHSLCPDNNNLYCIYIVLCVCIFITTQCVCVWIVYLKLKKIEL
mgnify:CR=1 FL=1